MNVQRMGGMALVIRYATMLLDHLPAAVYLDTLSLVTNASVRVNILLKLCHLN